MRSIELSHWTTASAESLFGKVVLITASLDRERLASFGLFLN
jgi:hypothetical protein